jgi:hypothetical protein
MIWGTMQAETVQLPDDLLLPATALPLAAAPRWSGSRLRRRLLWRAGLSVFAFAFLVVGLVFLCGQSPIRPVRAVVEIVRLADGAFRIEPRS